MDINDIKKILPHRYPFLLIDRIIDFEPDIEIKPNAKDGLRSWTIDLPEIKNLNEKEITLEQKRKRIFTSANRLIYDWSFCLITKKD